MDQFEAARRVFGIFQEARKKNLGASAWLLEFDAEEDEKAGLTAEEREIGLEVLETVELIEPVTMNGGWGLTDHGKYVCLHPSELDEALGPPSKPVPSQQFHIHAQQLQAAQFGNNNVMTTTYGALLSDLAERIGALDLPEEKKVNWLNSMNEMVSHPLMQTLIQTAATIGVAATSR